MFGFSGVFPREEATRTVVYKYHQAKASDSSSEYTGVRDDFTPIISSRPRLPRWASDSLFWVNRAALGLWLLVVLAAACFTLLPSMHRPTLGLPVVADDPTNNVPSFAPVMQEFQLTEEYTTSNVTDAEVDRVLEAWKKLMPMGRGFVKPTRNLNQLTVGIGSGDFPETDGLRGVAVFHEIHCLYTLLKEYYDAVRGLESSPMHTQHCFEYLRLTLMCHADTTLEGRSDLLLMGGGRSESENESIEKGPKAKHVCKSFDQVFEWVQRRRETDEARLDRKVGGQ